MVTILMMSAKKATLGRLKVTVFWNKGYDAKIFVYDVKNKILSRDLDYLANMVMSPKFARKNTKHSSKQLAL